MAFSLTCVVQCTICFFTSKSKRSMQGVGLAQFRISVFCRRFTLPQHLYKEHRASWRWVKNLYGQPARPANQHASPANQRPRPANQHPGPTNQLAIPANQPAMSTNQFVWPANRLAWPVNQLAWPTNQLAWHANQLAWSTNQPVWPANESARAANYDEPTVPDSPSMGPPDVRLPLPGCMEAQTETP